ncbi:hypothetical protein GT034_01730 [Streptomyces sp. SID2563]|uniref:hypothetical protein n=1 Tax=Streptomyces sp. SID2563 TaxID=2690255 RepID=UPI00136A536A|nr:hypothetical protein [Streptomyces sp. SID2563]MYW07089.1 hypothetical protein [Streptomyces sp. SID2563]
MGQSNRSVRLLARLWEPHAIVLVHLRDGHGTDGMLDRANKILSGLDKPPLAELRAADQESVPVGVTGKVLKRRLREAYAAAAVHRC